VNSWLAAALTVCFASPSAALQCGGDPGYGFLVERFVDRQREPSLLSPHEEKQYRVAINKDFTAWIRDARFLFEGRLKSIAFVGTTDEPCSPCFYAATFAVGKRYRGRLPRLTTLLIYGWTDGGHDSARRAEVMEEYKATWRRNSLIFASGLESDWVRTWQWKRDRRVQAAYGPCRGSYTFGEHVRRWELPPLSPPIRMAETGRSIARKIYSVKSPSGRRGG
jgi:hypothetical protein